MVLDLKFKLMFDLYIFVIFLYIYIFVNLNVHKILHIYTLVYLIYRFKKKGKQTINFSEISRD